MADHFDLVEGSLLACSAAVVGPAVAGPLGVDPRAGFLAAEAATLGLWAALRFGPDFGRPNLAETLRWKLCETTLALALLTLLIAGAAALF